MKIGDLSHLLAVAITLKGHLGRRKELSADVAFGPGFHARKMSKTNKQLKWHVAINNINLNSFNNVYTSGLLPS
jgi:hypothetical protein